MIKPNKYIAEILKWSNMRDSKKCLLPITWYYSLQDTNVLLHHISNKVCVWFFMLQLLDPSCMPCIAHTQISHMLKVLWVAIKQIWWISKDNCKNILKYLKTTKDLYLGRVSKDPNLTKAPFGTLELNSIPIVII